MKVLLLSKDSSLFRPCIEQSSPEAVHGALVRSGQTTRLDHLVLVLYQELDALNGGSHGLGDTGCSTTQQKVLIETDLLDLLLCAIGRNHGATRHCRQLWKERHS